jgi:F-type H+-transporting ATPase subunit b
MAHAFAPVDCRRGACERRHKLAQWLIVATVVLWAAGAPIRAAQEPASTPHEAGQAEAETAHEEGHPTLDMVARLVNFAVLAGTLYYFLNSPLRGYLADRRTQIRADLVNAADMKQAAAAQIEEIDRKLKALPGEIDALRAQGAREIAAEEERIRTAAAAERDRLLEQARRDIDLQVKVAERDLVAHAADLAVGVAADRIKKNITDEDQKRLVDRYVGQLRP